MAIIMDGRELARRIKEEIKEEIKTVKLRGRPVLYSVLVGNDEASKSHIRVKTKALESVGIEHKVKQFDEGTPQEKIENFVGDLSDAFEGPEAIMIQLPLPKGYDPITLIDQIDPKKDVDGLSAGNIARLYRGTDCLEPCTLKSVFSLLDYYRISPRGEDVAVIGSRGVFGKPLSLMMIQKGATVHWYHSETNSLEERTSEHDILVTAIGKPNYITVNMIKKGAVVIDVGENKFKGRIVGDVDFESVKEKAGYITPVPGGVGPMTVASLMQNIVKACKMQGSDIPF